MKDNGHKRFSIHQYFYTPLLRDLLDGIRSEPARVALSFTAVAIGIVALVLLLAVLGGLREKSRLLIRELGANVFAVLPEIAGESGQKRRLEEKHAALLARNLPGCVVSVMRRYELDAPGVGKKIGIIAADESLAAVRGWGIRRGRFLDHFDILRGERNAAISASLAEWMRWKVGDVVSLEDTPFRIIGIVESGIGALENGSGNDRLDAGENVMFVPKTAPFPKRGEQRESSHRADAIFVRVAEDSDIHKSLAIAQNLLGQSALNLDPISWVTPESLIQGVQRLQSSVRVAGGSVTFLCLVLGGTTLMSLMIANVRDRVVEIGLRRSLGATARDVAKLFVLEACAVTSAAALAGMLSAGLILLLVQKKFSMMVSIGVTGMVLPFALSIVLGVVFSYWPARMAARISPADALRNE
jgi:putative ABC transport system permease protein